VIRDRISYTAQTLEVASYSDMVQWILKFKEFCFREDVFDIILSITEAQTEEEYLEHMKRIVWFTKLVAPEILQLYYWDNYIGLIRHPNFINICYELHPYGAVGNEHGYATIHKQRSDLLAACKEYE
jgi:hypothetical protein